MRLYGELHRFVPVLAAARGFRVGRNGDQPPPAAFGRSKYGVSRFVKGFLDLLTVKFLTGFGQRPQHLLGTAGLASLLGLLGLADLAGLVGHLAYSRRRLEPSTFTGSGLALFDGIVAAGRAIDVDRLAGRAVCRLARPATAGYSMAERTSPPPNSRPTSHDSTRLRPQARDRTPPTDRRRAADSAGASM